MNMLSELLAHEKKVRDGDDLPSLQGGQVMQRPGNAKLRR